MNSRPLVDPELEPLLALLPTTTITHENLRARRGRQAPDLCPPAPGISLDTRFIPGPAGAPDILMSIYRPDNAAEPLPAVYHIHGGGYVAGTTAQLDIYHRSLVADLRCALVAVDYRLAPETIFPGALEDCLAGLEWLIAHARMLGIDASRLGLVGESAGGGLAAGLSLLLRDRGMDIFRFQQLIAPMLDDRTCVAADPHPFCGEHLWHAANNRFGWSAMLGHAPGAADISPYAAPARAERLEGLPPTYISVGALDLFLEENMEFARRLTRAGVPVEFHVWPGAIHGFELMSDTAIARRALAVGREAMRRAL